MKKIIIIGAGEGGKRLAGEILRTKSHEILGFLDDNLNLKNQEIFGAKVFGKINDLEKLKPELKPDEIFIAIPSLQGKKLEKIIDYFQKTNIKVQIMPGIFESLAYQSSNLVPAGKLRAIKIGDLLERQKITLDLEKVSSYLTDKVILITGAGGSIGSELARRISEFGPSKLILLDNYENRLYELQQEINNSNFVYEVADIKDKKNLENIFQKYQPKIIFHAAAHKHVPLMEKAPQEAVKNNILGSDNLIDLAVKYKIDKFIFISTDKAISPTSIMGATKRFTEEQILSCESSKPIFAIVRFGNVLGSYGSVIPLWEQQLAAGRPLAVTHPEMKRFFMTIPEAVQLVIQAGAMAQKANVYVLKMGSQYKILDLAKKIIKLSGFTNKNQIVFSGIRPGEKLVEILNEKDEKLEKTIHQMIMEIKKSKKSNQNTKKYSEIFRQKIDTLTKKEIEEMLQKAISSYEPYNIMKKPIKINHLIHFSPPFIGKEEEKAVQEVLKSKWLTMGPKVLEFEKEFAKYLQVPIALSISSATAGLHLALVSLGIKTGDEVIVPSYTFASCANTIVWTGARPVFADIQKNGFLINPQEIEKKITKKTKAIMIVHFGGQMAAMDEILKIAKKHNLKVIEDCAHSPGAKFDGQMAGTVGDIGVFSFYSTKNLTSGEGGMIVLKDSNLSEKIKVLRLHGMDKDAFSRYTKGGSWAYQITVAGFKDNMTDLAAAIGLEQLKKLGEMNQKRKLIAQKYFDFLSDSDDLILPSTLSNRENVWHLFPILVNPKKRNQIIEDLKKYNIVSSVHFIPLHLQPYYQKTFNYKKGDLPISEWVYEREISLPMHPGLTFKEVEYITDVIKYLLDK